MKKLLFKLIPCCFTFILLICNSLLAKQDHTLFDSIAEQIDELSYYQEKKSRELLKTLYQIAAKKNDTLLLAKCLYSEAKIMFSQKIINDSLQIKAQQLLDRIDPKQHLHINALLNYVIGTTYFMNNDYGDAFIRFSESCDLFKLLNDSVNISHSIQMIGTVCYKILFFEMSEQYLNEALKWVKKSDLNYFQIQHNILAMHMQKGFDPNIIPSLRTIIKEAKSHFKEEIIAPLYLTLSYAYSGLEQNFDSSYYYFSKTETLFENIDAPQNKSTLYSYKGQSYFMEKEYQKALNYYNMVYEIRKNNTNQEHLLDVYYWKYHIFNKTEQIDSAFFYLKKYSQAEINRSVNRKTLESYQKYITTYLEITEKNLLIAEQDIKLKNRRLYIIYSISAFAILFMCFILILMLQQKKRKTIENRELISRLSSEQKIKELQKENIETKTREIASYSLLLSNKNDTLKQILEFNQQLTEKENVEISKKINSIIKSSLNIDDEWHAFKIHFEEVHPRFFEKLKEINPKLTEDNLRMCTYFKIGLGTKQIAQLLNITPKTVFVYRTRLKKKFNLSNESDLDDFIRNI